MFADLKTFLKNSVDSICYSLTPKRRLDTQARSQHLSNLFATYRIDTVFDIGANEGQYRDFLRRRVGYQGLILSFEPIPSLANQLSHRAEADPNWRVFNCALGASNECRAFNIMRMSVFSSFLEPTSAHTADFHHINQVDQNEQVQIRTMDSILPDLLSEYPEASIYMKIDTQGFDLEVLKGSENSLYRIAAIQTELSITPIYENMPRYIDVLKCLDDKGFAPSGFFPVNQEQQSKLIEIDCCLVNSRYTIAATH